MVFNVYEPSDCRWVYEKDGMFRAELEGEDGVVKGVYTVEDQQGNVETQAYISGGQQGGHRCLLQCRREDTTLCFLTDWSSSGILE